MNIYILITSLMLFFIITTRSHYGISKLCSEKGIEKKIRIRQKDVYQNFAIIIIGLLLVLITGFRSPKLSEDYQHYNYIFLYRIRYASWQELLWGREFLFSLLMKIIGELSGYNIVVLMTVLAFVTCFFLLRYINNNSTYPIFVIFLLFTIGSYCTSFNTTRQYLAIALYTISFEYACNRKKKEYIISVLLISLIHTSSLLMLPFYWLLNLSWKNKNKIIINLCLLIGIFGFFFLGKYMLGVFIDLYYHNMNHDSTLFEQRLSLLNLTRPAFIVCFALLYINRLNFHNPKDNCLLNSAIFFFVFYLYSYQITLFMRFTYFFIPGSLILIDTLLDRISFLNRKIIIVFLIFFCFMWCSFGLFQNEYQFFWQI